MNNFTVIVATPCNIEFAHPRTLTVAVMCAADCDFSTSSISTAELYYHTTVSLIMSHIFFFAFTFSLFWCTLLQVVGLDSLKFFTSNHFLIVHDGCLVT